MGTSLYANDAASDIRGDYVDKLRRGKTNEEATRELIEKNREIMGDVEEEPLFWYALADTQWNYGRLLPEVKEKALYFLSKRANWKGGRNPGKQSSRPDEHFGKTEAGTCFPRRRLKKGCRSTAFTNASGTLGMYMPIGSAANTAKKKILRRLHCFS